MELDYIRYFSQFMELLKIDLPFVHTKYFLDNAEWQRMTFGSVRFSWKNIRDLGNANHTVNGQ